MKIKTLSGRNISGQTFSHELAPVTVFAGANFAGKTTRINALTLALAGYVPGVGKTGRDVFTRLASGDKMTVEVSCDKGMMEMTWKEERGSVRYFGPTEEARCIPLMPSVALDAAEYFALSEAERTKFLFARATLPPELKITSLTNAITANVKNIKLEVNTEATEAVLKSVAEFICDAGFEADLGMTPQGWLEKLLSDAKEKKKLADATVKRLESTAAGLTQTASAEDPAPPDAEQRLQEAQRTAYEANAEVSRLAEKLRELTAQYQAKKRIADSAVDEAQIQQQIATLETERQKFQSVPQPEPEAQAPMQMDAQTALQLRTILEEKERLFKSIGERPSDETAFQFLRVCNEQHMIALSESNRAADAWNKATQELHDIANATECEKCGQSIREIVKDLIPGLQEKAVAASKDMSLTEAATLVTESRLQGAKESLANIRAAIAKYDADQAAFRKASQDYADLQDKVRRDTHAAWQFRQDAYLLAQQSLVTLGRRIAELTAKLGSNEAKEAAAALPTLAKDGADARTALDAAKTASDAANAAVASANVVFNRLLQERADEAARARAGEARDAAKTEALVWKEVCAMLLELQAKLVDAAVGPLLEKMNDFCLGILLTPLVYKDGEIGRETPTGFASHRVFSGTEKALTYCAASIALAAGAPIKLAILDEMGRLDSKNKQTVVTNVLALITNGTLDQCVLVDTDPKAYANFEVNENFKLIKL